MNKERYFQTLNKVDSILSYFSELIDNCGEVKVIKNINMDSEVEIDVYHDYIYYCFTKSCRSLISSIMLAREGLKEDCLIILRTIYENYLHMAHTLNNPKKIQEYVVQTVGLSAGSYSYKLNKDRKYDYNKVVKNKNGKEYFHGTNNSFKSKESINSIDYKLHKTIYGYLSEYTHPNMLSSGNYRSINQENYTAFPKQLHLETPFFILYLTYLQLDAIYIYHSDNSMWKDNGFNIIELIDYHKAKAILVNEIKEYLKKINTEILGSNFKSFVIKRITML